MVYAVKIGHDNNTLLNIKTVHEVPTPLFVRVVTISINK